MRIVLVEPEEVARAALVARLSALGMDVAAFRDAHTAFLFLLGRLGDVEGVLFNGDDDRLASRLLQRLEMLPSPLAAVRYSGRDPEAEAAMRVVSGPGDDSLQAPRTAAGRLAD